MWAKLISQLSQLISITERKKKEKIRAQTEVIEQWQKEIENLKAVHMQLDKKMIEAMMQAMACMYNTQKGSGQKSSDMEPSGGKPYLVKSGPPGVAKGHDGITNLSLICHYCRNAGHNLDKCSQQQHKIRREQLVAESIIFKQVLNKKHSWKGVW